MAPRPTLAGTAIGGCILGASRHARHRGRPAFRAAALAVLALGAGVGPARGFTGGGGSLLFGTGSPSSIDAASRLSGVLGIRDEVGNYVAGVQGFYQGERWRLGGAFQAHAWGGVNPGRQGADEDAAGVAAIVGGLYATWTLRHDRLLLNAGGTVGAGRCLLGYRLGDENEERKENVATFFLQPHASLGVATCRWFGVEFQFSVPVFILAEDLSLTYGGETYTVTSGDLAGVDFSAKLTFGRIAEL